MSEYKNNHSIVLTPIGIIHSPRSEVEDDFWGNVISIIELNPNILDTSATDELLQFSHVEIIYYMHQVKQDKVIKGARHPRNDYSYPNVGILAQRAKNRINQLGLSRAKLLNVNGLTITVQGLDAIDGTPVLDIKPLIREFLPAEEIKQPGWADEIMKNYYK